MNKYIVKLDNFDDIQADGWTAPFAEYCIKKGMLAYWEHFFDEVGKLENLTAQNKIDIYQLMNKMLDKAFDSVRIIEVEEKKEEAKENE